MAKANLPDDKLAALAQIELDFIELYKLVSSGKVVKSEIFPKEPNALEYLLSNKAHQLLQSGYSIIDLHKLMAREDAAALVPDLVGLRKGLKEAVDRLVSRDVNSNY